MFDYMEKIADHLGICALCLRLGSISLTVGLWSASRRGELVTHSWVGGGTHVWVPREEDDLRGEEQELCAPRVG